MLFSCTKGKFRYGTVLKEAWNFYSPWQKNKVLSPKEKFSNLSRDMADISKQEFHKQFIGFFVGLIRYDANCRAGNVVIGSNLGNGGPFHFGTKYFREFFADEVFPLCRSNELVTGTYSPCINFGMV